jgi:ABC-type transporter Mla subunit MlaD
MALPGRKEAAKGLARRAVAATVVLQAKRDPIQPAAEHSSDTTADVSSILQRLHDAATRVAQSLPVSSSRTATRGT